MQPIDHSKAIARVTLDGLAICHFDKNNRHWQVRILRESSHVLTLSIDGECVDEMLLRNARSIRISTVDPDPPSYGEYPEGCFYIKGSYGNRENMSWALNLSDPELMGETVHYRPPTAFPVTMLDISDALFYVTKPFPTDLYRVPSEINPNRLADLGERYIYGVTSDELGADIFCKLGGKVVVEIEGHAVATLDYASRIHYIDFRNMDLKAETGDVLEKGDFEFYYEALEPTSRRYAFWGKPKTESSPDPCRRSSGVESSLMRERFSDRTDCNSVWMEP